MAEITRGQPCHVKRLHGCARCDGDGHDNLTFEPLTYPIPFEDGYVATHWCPCPTNGEPILNGDGDYREAPLREVAWLVVKWAEGHPGELPAAFAPLVVSLRAAFDA